MIRNVVLSEPFWQSNIDKVLTNNMMSIDNITKPPFLQCQFPISRCTELSNVSMLLYLLLI